MASEGLSGAPACPATLEGQSSRRAAHTNGRTSPRHRPGQSSPTCECGHQLNGVTAQPVSVPHQPPAFLIGEAEPATHVPAEDAIFFDQAGHALLLPLVEPADQRSLGPAERRRVEHVGKSVPLPDSGP